MSEGNCGKCYKDEYAVPEPIMEEFDLSRAY